MLKYWQLYKYLQLLSNFIFRKLSFVMEVKTPTYSHCSILEWSKRNQMGSNW